MLGYRFSRILVDESPVISAQGNKVRLFVQVGFKDPELSDIKTSEGRSIVEITVDVTVGLGGDDEKPVDQLGSEVLAVRCIAGFATNDDSDEDLLNRFAPHTDGYHKSVYWVARQRAQSLLTETRFRKLVLPWEPTELDDSGDDDRQSSTVNVHSKKKPPKPRSKRAS